MLSKHREIAREGRYIQTMTASTKRIAQVKAARRTRRSELLVLCARIGFNPPRAA